ncbi:MAG: acetyl-CoA carboxylase carboxyl transferase subunit alpha, partial [Sphingopyxis terrae]
LRAPDAATAMKMSAQDLLGLKVIDRIVTEPVGGAHRAPEVAIQSLGDALAQELDGLQGQSRERLRTDREDKFLAMGRA